MPGHIRSDNGPEFIAAAIREWLVWSKVGALYVEPGAPWENGYAEAFQGRLRDELLNVEESDSVREAKALGARWHWQYNHEWPHSALRYRTPAGFAAACVPPGSGPLRLPEHTLEEELVTLVAPGTQNGGTSIASDVFIPFAHMSPCETTPSPRWSSLGRFTSACP